MTVLEDQMKIKQKLLRSAALLLTFVMLSVMLTGCGEKGKVKGLIADFESACQSADLDAVLDCIDPQVTSPLKSVMGLLGIDTSKVSELVRLVIGTDLFNDYDLSALPNTDNLKTQLSTLTIKPTSYTFNSAKDECRVKVTYSGSLFGEDFSEEGELSCVLRGETWYLAAF